MADNSVEPALGCVQIVPKRDATTLLPIIQHHVAPGTVVWSDEWAAYNHVTPLPNVSTHDVFNHSVEFVSPSGVYTQNVKSYLNRIKIKLRMIRGCHEQQLASYLDEFMYRERRGQTARQCFDSISISDSYCNPVSRVVS